MTFSPEIEQWLKKNSGADYAAMMLKAGGDPERRRAVVQQEARRRARLKLPLYAGNDEFEFPSLLAVEQCTSQLLAEYHATLIRPESTVVDLTAGLGIDAMTFAQNARSVTAIEQNAVLADALRHNSSVIGLGNMNVIEGDSMQWLAENDCHFDVAFIDPYRRDSSGGKVVGFADCTPDVVANLKLILSRADQLIIKASPMHDVSLAAGELGERVHTVKIIGTKKECKELLLILSADKSSDFSVGCITIMPDGSIDSFSCEIAGKRDLLPVYSFPEQGDWVYELWPAVMKGGAYNVVAERTGTCLLAPFTHVYTSRSPVENFPGKPMRVESVYPFNKQSIKQLKAHFGHLNVAVRNFPISAPELEKRLGIKPGGEHRLLGVTDQSRKQYLLLLKEI